MKKWYSFFKAWWKQVKQQRSIFSVPMKLLMTARRIIKGSFPSDTDPQMGPNGTRQAHVKIKHDNEHPQQPKVHLA
jgi:hypothetical protein